jgi:hypothetical protein
MFCIDLLQARLQVVHQIHLASTANIPATANMTSNVMPRLEYVPLVARAIGTESTANSVCIACPTGFNKVLPMQLDTGVDPRLLERGPAL